MLNKVVLIGRLTRDPELRHTQSGTPVASFAIAVNRSFVSQNSQNGQPTADFFDIVAWNKTGEFVSRYFTKGMQVAVSGRLQNRSWTDKTGNKRVSTEIIADEVFFTESKKSSDSNQSFSPNKTEAPASFEFEDSDFSEIDDDNGDLPF